MLEKKRTGKDIYRGSILYVVKDEVELEDGTMTTREVVHHPGGAGILLINKQEEVLLVRQYRYVFGETLLEIPAGKLEVGEDPLVAAKRELEEETGYRAKTLTSLGILYPTVGYSDEKIYLYLATNAELHETHFDRDERIEQKFYPLSDVLRMIEKGQIKDAKTIGAIFHYLQKKGN